MGGEIDVWEEVYGDFAGVFLVSPEGEIVKHWPNVKPDGHAEEVIKELKSEREKE